jgi:hypothetical protein
MSPDDVRAVFDIAAECRLVLQMSNDEISTARRRLRRRLRETGTKAEVTALHRSAEARFIFQRSGRRVIQAGREQMNLRDLLEGILDHLPPDARQFLKASTRHSNESLDEWPDYIIDATRS